MNIVDFPISVVPAVLAVPATIEVDCEVSSNPPQQTTWGTSWFAWCLRASARRTRRKTRKASDATHTTINASRSPEATGMEMPIPVHRAA